jgi:hypothetical protein
MTKPKSWRRCRSWSLLAVLCFASCATGRRAPDPFVPPPEDLACDEDADCGIVGNSSVYSCRSDPKVEPYAISHAATARHRAGRSCPNEETLQLYEGDCHTRAEDWEAVCSWHVCKRQKVHFFSSLKVYCPY